MRIAEKFEKLLDSYRHQDGSRWTGQQLDEAITGLGFYSNHQMESGNFQPFNFDCSDNDAFPAPAPNPHNANPQLSTFDGQKANGDWSLFVMDDSGGDCGVLETPPCREPL